MNTTMVERNCADCLLRAMEGNRAGGQAQDNARLDADSATEQQLVLLERRYGPNWKW